MRIKIFSHNDLDGYACSIIAQLAVGRENVHADYCGYYNINEKIMEFIDNRSYESYDYIFITDISITEEVAQIIENNNILKGMTILLDHHPTVIGLNKYEWCTVQIEDEIEKVCGTSLLYNYLVNKNILERKVSIELFVDTVKRYDTWLWKDKYNDLRAKQLNDLFKIYGQERFEAEYYKRLTSDVFCMINDTDKFLLELENEKIQKYIDKKNKFIYKKTLNINGKKFRAGIVVADDYLSELGNELSERNPDLDFIAMVAGLSTVSYRTVKKNIDLGNEVAIYYGGGDHPQAAGSQISYELRKQILDSIIK